MTTYTINLQVEGERAVGIVAALHADGYHAEATEINRQVHAQREAVIRNLWVHGAPQERKAAEASKIDEFMRVIFGR